MAYVSLYRKYRPQTFAEVVGQEHVTATLAKAVAEDRIHHAYLFTGPRGTGKTSTARILAKSLNCEQGPTTTPCNACAQCAAITAGSSIDVIEIDAASHGGVDDVRDLRDRVAFAPAGARMKVYIVDECHMLSTAGWNAFLKTVEEPPGHVVFVFATTEPHKVLPTILSRTQRFDFKRVSAAALDEHVRRVGEAEGLEFEPGAVDLVVRAGDGSVRDTLSVLDQVLAYTGRTVGAAGVADVLGTIPDELLGEAADLVAAGDVAGVCGLVQRLADAGHDLRQFARDAVEHLRALFLLQVAPDADLVTTTPERLAGLKAQAGRLGRVELLRAVELLADAQAQMRRGNTRLPLEVALVKAALPEACGDPAALAARMDRLERRTGVDPQPAAVAPDAPTTPAPTPEPEPVAPVDAPRRSTRTPAPASPERSGGRDAAPTPSPDPPGGHDAAPPPAPASPDPSGGHDAAPPASPDPSGGHDASADQPTAAGDPPAGGSAAADPADQPAAGVDLELVRRSWPAILDATKGRKRTLHAYVTESHPVALERGVLTLEFKPGYDFHAENCAREDSQRVLSAVFHEVLGVALRITCTVADGRSASASTGPAEDADVLREQAADVAEVEAAAAAGELPDDDTAHARAVETLRRGLGATVIDEA